MSTGALRVRGLSVTADDGRRLLSDVDLDVAPGEQVLVVGASGSGKSTLLRLAAGLSAPPGTTVTGSVEVSGREVVGREEEDDPLDVGWLPQDPAASVCLPVVEDDVALGCENRRHPVERIEREVATALALVDGAAWRRRDTGTLSAGQAQRVGLAAATAPAPALLLLDEPTSMLDPGALRQVRAAVATIAARPDPPAVLLVEHRLDEWADDGALPGRVVVLAHGRVVADGPTDDVWRTHAARLASSGAHLPWQVERSLPRDARPRRVPPPSAQPSSDHAGEALLDAHGLDVARDAPLLIDADLQVRAGEVVALLGSNGVGKSTLLLTLAGLRRPAAGRLAWPGGRPALVFGEPVLQFLAPTVGEELAHDGASASQVAATLAEIGLQDAADRSVHRLSGGQQRRLSVATVLLGDRRVVLADEPTFGLDRGGLDQVVDALRGAAAAGRGVLVVSHDLRFVLEVADRVHAIAQGRLLGGGPTREVLGSDLPARAGLGVPAAVREQLTWAA